MATKKTATDTEILEYLPLAAAYLQQGGKLGQSLSLKSAAFRAQYEFHPDAFIRECFYWQDGRGPTFYQEELAAAVCTHKRVSARMPRGGGKTATLAMLVLWFALTRDGDDWKVITTAGGWRHLKDFLWPEIHKWARFLRWDKIFRGPFNERDELMSLSLQLRTGRVSSAASNKPYLLEGAHADRLMYVFDEAKSIPDTSFDAAEGAFSGAGAGGTEGFILVFSTPGSPIGRFYDIQSHQRGFDEKTWFSRHVTMQEVMSVNRMTEEWRSIKEDLWGPGSSLYRQQVLAEFASDDMDGVIPLAWIESSHDRWHKWLEDGKPGLLSALGADVGGGGDSSVAAPLFLDQERAIIPELKYMGRDNDTMAVTAELIRLVSHYGGDPSEQPIIVDSIGIGAGVVARLRELRKNVRPFNAATRTTARDNTGEIGFANYRAQAWWTLRELLDPAYEPTLCLPPDDRLTGDLVAPHYRTLSGPIGRVIVEGKPEIRKRIGRSTDAADAVIMALVGRHIGLGSSLDFLDSSLYLCHLCKSPVFDYGGSDVSCPHCGAILNREIAQLGSAYWGADDDDPLGGRSEASIFDQEDDS